MMLPATAEAVPGTVAGASTWNGSAGGVPGCAARFRVTCALATAAARSSTRARRLVIVPSFYGRAALYEHHVTKRCDLRPNSLVIADNDDRAAVRVEVLRGGALDLGRRHGVDLVGERLHEVARQIVDVDRADAVGEAG